MATGVTQLDASPQEVQAQQQLDQDLLAELEQRRTQAENAMKDTFRLWKENIAFIEGMQWIRVRESAMLNVQGISRNRIRIADNKLLDHARRLHARLDQVTYLPTVQAETMDDGDKLAARSAQAALRWFDRKKGVRKERRKVNWWIVVCGQAYVEAFFDPQGGPLIEVPSGEMEPAVDDSGEPVTEPLTDPVSGMEIGVKPVMVPGKKWEPQGDVDFLIRSPFAIRRDPRFQDWRKLRYLFVEEVASKEEVLDRFGDLVPDMEKRIPPAQYQTTPWLPELTAETSDMMGLPKHRAAVTDVVTLWRYYERPSKKHPEGRFVIYAANMILYSGPMPTPDYDFPVVPFAYLGRPWYFEGKSAVDAAKGLQRLYNRILSRFAEHLVRLPAGWLLVPVTSGIPKRSFTNETGSVIRYVPGGGEPKFVFPPFGGLAWYDRFLGRMETAIEDLMALPPAVRGQLPKGARAARTVELLQESADAIQAPVLNDISDSWGIFYEKILMFMHKHFTTARIITFVGEDKQAETMEFKGDVLPRNWHDRLAVKVEGGESLPSSKMMRIEFILTLAQRHAFFGQPGSPEYIKKLAEALDLDAGFMKDDSNYDVSIAEDENIKIIKGDDTVHLRPYDDHLTHLRVHLLFMKRMVVSNREDEADKVFPHLQEHQGAMAEMMAAQAKGSAPVQPLVPGQVPGQPAQPGQPGAPPGGQAEPQKPPVTKPGGTGPQGRVMESSAEQVLGRGNE